MQTTDKMLGACEVQEFEGRGILRTTCWQVFSGKNFSPSCFINGEGSWEPHWLSCTEPTSASSSLGLISLSAGSPKFCGALLESPPSPEAQGPPRGSKRSPQDSPLASQLLGYSPWETDRPHTLPRALFEAPRGLGQKL